ncbi:MAG: glycosyltransferase family 4 protein [Planctomycetes bacterium]|nr:glycosyltransferase family 4 protein [Planctomycetota bacterium]
MPQLINHGSTVKAQRTLLFSEIFPPRTGGSGRWFWEIYRRLPRDRYAFAVGEHARQDEFDSVHDLHLERLPLAMPEWGLRSFAGLRDYWRNVRQIRGVIRRHNVTRIHCARCLPEGVVGLAIKKLTGTPYMCYVHGEDVNTAMNSREHAMLVRWVLKHTDCCIANSRNTANLLMQNWNCPVDRVRILHPGVDTTRFTPAARSDVVRCKLGWGDRPVVLTVGRLQRRKGHDMLIRALPDIRAKVPGVLFAIVGNGEEREYLEGLSHQLGVADHVQFRGETTDEELVQCYQQCDLFALPNREIDRDIEGFGMVLVEAQACGKPVIAGDSGGTAETMQVGKTGLIVDCREPEPLAKGVVSLLTSPEEREAMGRAGRQWVLQQFDWEQLARQASTICT